MNKFQTVVSLPKYNWKTGYSKTSLFMGSCFTENMGNRLKNLKYNVDVNPFGILYNPSSLAKGLQILLDDTVFSESNLVHNNYLWHSFSHHGRFSKPDKTETLQGINQQINNSSAFLQKADFLFLTFGTAWIYKLKNTDKIVANCHKFPANDFLRMRLTVDDIVEEYKHILNRLWEFNPGIKVIFTLSPVRHLKDGAIENQLSKATLLLAINAILHEFGEQKCTYFPAYEIVMDELRDYRFYAADMTHLSDVAIEHIWQYFKNSMIDVESCELSQEVQKIINAVNHRPINKLTKQYLFFLNNALEKIKLLELKFSYLNFKLEKEYFIDEIDKINNTLEQS